MYHSGWGADDSEAVPSRASLITDIAPGYSPQKRNALVSKKHGGAQQMNLGASMVQVRQLRAFAINLTAASIIIGPERILNVWMSNSCPTFPPPAMQRKNHTSQSVTQKAAEIMVQRVHKGIYCTTTTRSVFGPFSSFRF